MVLAEKKLCLAGTPPPREIIEKIENPAILAARVGRYYSSIGKTRSFFPF